MTCGIYCIENVVTKMKYVGKGKDVEKRWCGHKSNLKNNSHINAHLQNSWNKYGENNFEFYIIEKCKKNKLNEREIYYIKELKTKNPNGYNLTDGGEGGLNPSEEVRRKMSESIKKVFSNGRSPNCSYRSEETKKKISSTMIKKYTNGYIHPMLGKKMSNEAKEKISLAKIGKPSNTLGIHRSDETRRKMSMSKTGKKNSASVSKYLGIRFHNNGWESSITIFGEYLYIGRYRSEIEAAKACDKYIIEHNLNYPLNFPEDYE